MSPNPKVSKKFLRVSFEEALADITFGDAFRALIDASAKNMPLLSGEEVLEMFKELATFASSFFGQDKWISIRNRTREPRIGETDTSTDKTVAGTVVSWSKQLVPSYWMDAENGKPLRTDVNELFAWALTNQKYLIRPFNRKPVSLKGTQESAPQISEKAKQVKAQSRGGFYSRRMTISRLAKTRKKAKHAEKIRGKS